MERRDSENAGFRRIRLQEIVFEEVALLLRDEVIDPELYGVRVTAVVLSVDYKNARVHFTIRRGMVPRIVARALERVSPFLRARIAESVDTKRGIALRFVCDGEEAVDVSASEDEVTS